MKKLFFSTMLILLTIAFTFSTAALAEYDSSGDMYVNLETAKYEPILLSSETAELSFEMQETLNQDLQEATGWEYDHSYIWISINGETVLAIDPPKPWVNTGTTGD